MAKNSLDEIWAAVCDECKKTVSEVAFSCFFKDLKPLNIEDGYFVMCHNNEYLCPVIEQNYSNLLSSAIKTIMGIDLKPKVVFEEEQEQIRKAEESSEGLTFADFFTFDNFIVGSSNRFAQAASFAVAEQPGLIKYNPFIIYGPSGVGKTHLMLAIMNHIKKKYPSKKIEYTSGEEFTNQLITALQEGKLGFGTINDFRTKFRDTDVLLVDDIHFIAGKEQTQEEFFNTFNTLYQNNKQIVVTLDRPLKEIKTLDERIRSRLSSGLFADISSPDFETRVGITRQKAEQSGISLDENILFYIAEQIKVNIRQIEGVVKKLEAYIKIENRNPSISIVQGFISDVINNSQPEPIKIDKIIVEVARTYNVSESAMLSNRKTAPLVLARQVAMYIARETTDMSYKQIGESFGKDHTTVLYNVKKIENFLMDKPREKEMVEDIIKNLKSTT
ncbi:MAG TPA: chromosomal replication initiator protein DnaA [Ruminococcaceae bacterium]|nr:chromosomal replication initiator protein DnaA [Oscillospiraceae bacterium]